MQLLKLIIITIFISFPFSNIYGKDIYVSPENTKGIKKAKPGDVVWFRGGTYSKPILLNGLKGTYDKPIILKSMPGEIVLFDGTDALEGTWKLVKQDSREGAYIQNAQWEKLQGNLYSLKLNKPINALIYNNRLMSTARWPSARWDDAWRLDRYTVLRRAAKNSSRGEIYDGLSTENTLEESIKWIHYDRSQLDYRDYLIGESGISYENAAVVMSHTWGSWATKITEHNKGENHFKYDTEFKNSGSIQKEAHTFLNKRIGWEKGKKKFTKSSHAGIQYFIMGLAALDIEEEWWYHKETSTLYFISPDGEQPNKKNTRGKRRDYLISANKCEYLYIEGIQFKGTAAKLSECKNSRIEDCNFKFASMHKFSIDNYDIPLTTTIINRRTKKNKSENFNNALINCQFTYQDGNAFLGRSSGLIIDNIRIYRTQQTTLGLDSRSMSISRPALVRRVTIDDVGASVGIKGGGRSSVYELNNIMHFGGLQYDGASLQLVGRDKIIYRKNWSHDHPKRSYRFDAGSYPTFANAFGEMSYNVAWNTPGGFAIKGDDHLIHNNLLIGESGFELFNMKHWASKNERTVVANNIVPNMSAGTDDWKKPVSRKNVNTGKLEKSNTYWLKETVVPDSHPRYVGASVKTFDDGHKRSRKAAPLLAIQKNNYHEAANLVLRDPINLDFRPKKSSKIIDAGVVLQNTDAPWKDVPFTGDNEHIGKKPDIGPYEYGDTHYWIPGFKFQQSSTPIPINGTRTAKPNCDLMWLGAYKTEEHRIFVGYSKKEVEEATTATEIFKGKNNIYSFPKDIEPGTTIYWRVDAVKENKTTKGAIWEFSVKNK